MLAMLALLLPLLVACGNTVGMNLLSSWHEGSGEWHRPPSIDPGLSGCEGTGEPAPLPPGHPVSACLVSRGSREKDLVHVGHLNRLTSSCVCW
uniref:Putative secreted protein n=1 Tax=Anopheles darlingi TaxID=43151 RepID=A0A2M4D9X9_ANODA